MQDLDKKINELFAKNDKMSVYEAAKELGVGEFDILKFRDLDEFKLVSGENFDKIIEDISTWGEIMFIKNTPEFIIEIKLKIQSGKRMHGYYNFHGGFGALGGHLKDGVVANIGFVSTKFMGSLGHSLHFYDKNNVILFKIFVARDEKMQLIDEQVKKFLALKAKF
ncbi:MAG: heme utilization cystosolic carrier protein HutX [Campylobacter sp.]|nr:heme utilization cystosolic carrier protein HutX [Campylobacter sp.]